MRRLLMAVALVAFCLADRQAAAQAPAAMRGRVLTDDTGTPVAAARIAVRVVADGGVDTTTFVESDDNGEFVATGLVSGDVWLRVTCAGFLDAAWPEIDPTSDGVRYRVAAGETLPGAEIRMRRGGAIEGHVFDTNGLPAVGRTVAAVVAAAAAGDVAGRIAAFLGTGSARIDSPLGAAARAEVKAVTDDRGHFRLHTLPANTYLVAVLPREVGGEGEPASDRVSGSRDVTWAPATTRAATASRFVIGAREEHTGVTITLGKAAVARVTGRALDDASEPAAGASVFFTRDDAGVEERPDLSTRTDEHGRFVIDAVPLGRWRVDVVQGAPGPDPRVPRRRSVTTVVDVTRDTAPLVLRVLTPLMVHGRLSVLDGPPPRSWAATEIVSQRSSSLWSFMKDVGFARVDEDGTFSVQVLGDEAQLSVVSSPIGYRLDRVLIDGRDRTDEVVTARELNGADVEIVFTSSGGFLSGRVTWPGVARDDCFVVVFSADSSQWQVGSRGVAGARCTGDAFLLGPVRPGDYLVAAVSRSGGAWLGPSLFSEMAEEGQRVSIRANEVTKLTLPVLRASPSPPRR